MNFPLLLPFLWWMATQALVAVTAQTLGKFAHYHPAYTIMYDFIGDGYISLVFEVPQEASPFYFGSMQLSGGPDTYDIDFLNPDKGLKALYDGIRDHFPLIDIKPGDLTTLTVVDEGVFARLQGRRIKLERWSFPAPGIFELYLPGPEEVEFIFEITAYVLDFVKLTLTCKNMIEQGGPGISDAVTGTFALTEQSSGSPNPWFELEDITNPTLPPSDEYPTLESLQEAFRASCAYPNPSDDDFKLVVPFSPDTVYMQAYTYTGELYPLTRISHTLPLGVFTYTEDVDPFTLVQYIFADPVGVNIQCSCPQADVISTGFLDTRLCHRDGGQVFCIEGTGTSGDQTSDTLAICRERCPGSRLAEGISFHWVFAPTQDAIYVPFEETTLRIESD